MAPVAPLLLDGGVGSIGGVVLLIVVVVAVFDAVEVVPTHERRALRVFGEYRQMLEPGIHVVPPFVSKTDPIEMRAQELTLPVEVRTRDGASIAVESQVSVRVNDPEAAFLKVEDYRRRLAERVETALQDEGAQWWHEDVLDDPRPLEDALERSLADVREWGLAVEEVGVEIADSDGGVAA